jgi:hypothetical protein
MSLFDWFRKNKGVSNGAVIERDGKIYAKPPINGETFLELSEALQSGEYYYRLMTAEQFNIFSNRILSEGGNLLDIEAFDIALNGVSYKASPIQWNVTDEDIQNAIDESKSIGGAFNKALPDIKANFDMLDNVAKYIVVIGLVVVAVQLAPAARRFIR